MGRRRSGYIQIDVSEYISEIDDDTLLDELAERKLSPAGPGETCDLDIVREAHEALNRGHAIEARIILESLIYPKWKSVSSCQNQYEGLFKK